MNSDFFDERRDELNEKISDLEERRADLMERREEVEGRLDSVRSEVGAATKDVAAAPSSEGGLQTAVESRSKADALEDVLGEIDGELEDVERELHAARSDLEALRERERALEIVGTASEAYDELQEHLQEALDEVLAHLGAAAGARAEIERARSALQEDTGSPVDAARRALEDGADEQAVALLLSSVEAGELDLPRPSLFPLKAEQTGHPGDTAALVQAIRTSLQALLKDRRGE